MGLFDKVTLNIKKQNSYFTMKDIQRILMELSFVLSIKHKHSEDHKRFSLFIEEISPRLREFIGDSNNEKVAQLEEELAYCHDMARKIIYTKRYQLMKTETAESLTDEEKNVLIRELKNQGLAELEELSKKTYKAINQLSKILTPVLNDFRSKVENYYKDGISYKSNINTILYFLPYNWQDITKHYTGFIFSNETFKPIDDIFILKDNYTDIQFRDWEYYSKKGLSENYSKIKTELVDGLVDVIAKRLNYYPGLNGYDRLEFVRRNYKKDGQTFDEFSALECHKQIEEINKKQIQERYYKNKVIGKGVTLSFDDYVMKEIETIKNYTYNDVPEALK